MHLIVTTSHTGNDIHNPPKVSAHYLNMGGDYIAVTYLGVEKICIHLNHAVHSLKSVICTSHLLPGCYGQQECKEQGNESTFTFMILSQVCVNIYMQALWGFSLKSETLNTKEKLTQERSSHNTPLLCLPYLPHLVWPYWLCGLQSSSEYAGWLIGKYTIGDTLKATYTGNVWKCIIPFCFMKESFKMSVQCALKGTTEPFNIF